MKNYISLIVFFLFLLNNTIAIACSVFNIITSNTVIAGRNQDSSDENSDIQYYISFSPASPEKNGTFFNIGKFKGSDQVYEGMNDKGLFIGIALVPKTTIIFDKTKKSTKPCEITKIILEKCSTVNEAVNEFSKYSISFDQTLSYPYPSHYMIADASGISVVVEFVNKEMRAIKKKGNFQYMTNTYLSKVNCTNFPWAKSIHKRNNILKSCLEKNNKVDTNEGLSILSKVAQTIIFNPTQTSIVYNLKNKNITLVWQRQYDKQINFNLIEELKKGKQVIKTSSLK